jgi:alpha-D-ribose 1-methylphosphonate 5-triphosphate synthase subunit PhnL
MSNRIVLQVKGLHKNFYMHDQNKAIPSASNVSFNVSVGKLTALVGATGSGKSTILKSIYRTYLTTQGSIFYHTAQNQIVDLTRLEEHQVLELRECEIGFVTQFLHCLPRKSTIDIIAQPLYRKNLNKQDARDKAKALLSHLRLPKRLWSVSPTTFSGGEKQRVNLARGIILRPRLLLLDEPTASLDPVTSELVLELLSDLKKSGCALLAVFHDTGIVNKMADDVITLAPPADNGQGDKY